MDDSAIICDEITESYNEGAEAKLGDKANNIIDDIIDIIDDIIDIIDDIINDIIDIKNFDLNNIKIDEKSYKNTKLDM